MSFKKWLPVALIVFTVIFIDQLAKWWIVNNMLIHETIPIIEAWQPYLQITRTTNTGFAFGLATGGSIFILILSSIITVGLLWMVAQTDESERLQIVGFAIIIGGALGNIIDRVRLNHVVDFVHITIPDVISNVSNFADHAVVIGVGLLLLDSLLQERRNPQKHETSEGNIASASIED